MGVSARQSTSERPAANNMGHGSNTMTINFLKKLNYKSHMETPNLLYSISFYTILNVLIYVDKVVSAGLLPGWCSGLGFGVVN